MNPQFAQTLCQVGIAVFSILAVLSTLGSFHYGKKASTIDSNTIARIEKLLVEKEEKEELIEIKEDLENNKALRNKVNSLLEKTKSRGEITIEGEIKDILLTSEALYVVGQVFHYENPKLAKSAYLKSVEFNEHHTNSLMNLASISFDEWNLDLSMEYWDTALKTAKVDRHIAQCLNGIGVIQYQKENLNEAEDFLNRSASLNRKLKNLNQLGVNYLTLSSIHLKNGHINRALGLLKDALSYSKQTNDTKLEIKILNRIGELKNDEYNAQEAESYARESLEKNEFELVKIEKYRSFTILAKSLSNTGKNDEAIEYYRKAIKGYREIESEFNVANSKNNLALILDRKDEKEFEEAYGLFLDAKNFFSNNGPLRTELATRINLCLLLREKEENYQDLIVELESIENIGGKKSFPEVVAEAKSQQGFIYAKLGQTRKAMGFFEDTLRIAQDFKFKNQETKAVAYLADGYLMLKDYQNAIANYKKYRKIQEEIGHKRNLIYAIKRLEQCYVEAKMKKEAIDSFLEYTQLQIDLGDQLTPDILKFREKLIELSHKPKDS